MAYVFRFGPASMNTAQYDDVINRLEAAGAGAPQGRLHHTCYGDPNALHVFDVWESKESFDNFGQTLMPILQEIGIDAGVPEIVETHNVVRG